MVSDVVVRFQALDVATKRNIVAYGALAAAIGPALVAISAINQGAFTARNAHRFKNYSYWCIGGRN
jgi:hypothetical protein